MDRLRGFVLHGSSHGAGRSAESHRTEATGGMVLLSFREDVPKNPRLHDTDFHFATLLFDTQLPGNFLGFPGAAFLFGRMFYTGPLHHVWHPMAGIERW